MAMDFKRVALSPEIVCRTRHSLFGCSTLFVSMLESLELEPEVEKVE